uniref:Myb-related transcription factor, partner of profilin n=1 Tax=Magallana gigas TaxID=29159 RepID=K1PK06_MAGGI
MEKELKRRKPNWSESELMALAEAVAPHFRVLKGKFSAFITSERKNQLWQDIANQVNAVAMVNRTTEEMKKKWADMQSLTKKKKAERRRSMKQTGGGPAPNFMFKNWENLVLQSLSDVAIEGISGGVDTAECESRPSPVVPAGIIIHEVPASENSELSESASTPCARMTSINNSTYKDMNFESESSQSQERPRKQTRVQRKGNNEIEPCKKHKMFLEVLALVCLLSRPLGARNPATASKPVISYNVKENRAHRVAKNPGSNCGLDPNLFQGSSECLIACLTTSNHLYGFGWNKNSSECRCCQQPVLVSANKVDGEGWETYLAGCLDNFYIVYHEETSRCLYHVNQHIDMPYSEAKSTCQNLGGILVKSSSTTDNYDWMKALVSFVGSSVYFEVVEDDALKPFICEKDPAFEVWN